jgi:SNF2 family DNA or RNA helicase
VTPPPLFRHQRELFDATKDLLAWALFFEQGTGKSAPTIHTAVHLYQARKIDGAIVVAPNGVHRNWITDELPKHCASAWAGLDWHSSREKAQDRAFKQLLENTGKLPWLAITYEGLLTPRGRAAVLEFKARYPRLLLVIDEGSRVKNPTTARTKKVAALRQLSTYARLLNGTPVTNSPTDLYSQMRLLDDRFWVRHGIGSWTAFQARFCVMKKIVIGGDDDRDSTPYGKRERIVPHGADPETVAAYEQLDLSEILTPEEIASVTAPAKTAGAQTTGRTIEVVVGYRELDKLKTMIEPMSTRITKEDAGLDLPPKLYSRILFDLTPEQRRVYDQLRREYMVELDNGVLITAALALVRVLRLQQIACGYLPNPDDPERPKLFFNEDGKNPRLAMLLDRLEDTPHQSIIWARFTPDVDAICRALGPPKCVRYDGEVSQKNRDEGIDRFRLGKAKFIVAKAQSMGVGLTLTEAKSVYYYSNTFSYYDRSQSEDRCHRIGTTTPVSYYDFEAWKTVDGKILQSLRENADIASKVTGDSYREWLEA